ncbi:type II toxin-antitoxin system VapC family toxin [Sandarakinorhabdus sp.]|uniref:type II toxin-antitoxin system VapC family toxin n=1 Tax=Sandarakinorhabdus sp. TaxID=1916663 RepID=UPI003341A059
MTVVFDASAVLALVRGEPGDTRVANAMQSAVICAVNVAEVVERLRRDFAEENVIASLGLVLPPTLAADRELAVAAGLMRAATRSAGLSTGDCFCLALGARLQAKVLTADRKWAEIADQIGVQVQLIR